MRQRRILLYAVATLLLLLASLGIVARGRWLLPDDPGAALQQRYGATELLDRHGQPLRWLHGPDHTRAQPVALTAMSPKLVAATLALEDQRFWQHSGVDAIAIVRAIGQNFVRLRRFSGASTLTQQLVKQMQPRQRTWSGKAVEALAALQLDAHYPKPTILAWYLNWAPYGGLVRGVQAASRGYFHKEAKDLTWAEASYLAVLPRAPGRLDPLLHPQRALAAQRRLLHVLQKAGTLTQAELDVALAEPVLIQPEASTALAPHLADLVADQLHALWHLRPTRMQTTLDAPLQDAVAQLLRVHLAGLRERHVGNGAVVVIDNATMEVRALVGSANYADAAHLGANDGALMLRQPGSTMKAFAYAAAFAAPEKHLTPATLLADLEAHFATAQGDYAPRNYGDATAGPLRARVALASSVNIAAVRLVEQVGVGPLLQLLHALGLTSLDRAPEHYGLGLVLGDGEVTLLDLTGAFAALARLGSYLPPRWLAAVQLGVGQPLLLPREPPRQVLPATAAFQVLDILADPVARQPAFGRGGPLELPFQVAAKTGTSKGFRDNWALGATPRWTVGVWVGNFDGTPMQDVSGVTGAAPLLHAVLLRLVGDGASADFTAPEGLQRVAICPLSGGAHTPLCPTAIEEWFAVGADPQPCLMHQQIAIDRRTGQRATPGCPEPYVVREVFAILPPQFDRWAQSHLPQPPPLSPSTAPLAIDEPPDGAVYQRDSQLPDAVQQISLSAHGSTPIRWEVDGHALRQTASGERLFWTPPPGRHQIRATDRLNARAAVAIEVLAP
jgi:penicillin-binding protein 1C